MKNKMFLIYIALFNHKKHLVVSKSIHKYLWRQYIGCSRQCARCCKEYK